MKEAAFATAVEWFAQAPHVLITAGAGLSASAGFDYGDTKRFAELFPAFVKQGFTARYQTIGYNDWTAAEKWGYWAIHVDDIRFGPRCDPIYRDLLSVVKSKDYFVMTSNVDQLFPRNGFDSLRMFTPQGDYGLIQCNRGCKEHVWDSEPVVARLLECIDPLTQTVQDDAAIPRCPTCGGETFLNVRIDRFFVERPYDEQRTRITNWSTKVGRDPVLVVEIGAGFNTPGVVRWPGEQLVASHPESKLIRINAQHPDTPAALAGRALGFAGDASIVVARLKQSLES